MVPVQQLGIRPLLLTEHRYVSPRGYEAVTNPLDGSRSLYFTVSQTVIEIANTRA